MKEYHYSQNNIYCFVKVKTLKYFHVTPTLIFLNISTGDILTPIKTYIINIPKSTLIPNGIYIPLPCVKE